MRVRALALALVVALAAPACGGDGDGDEGATPPSGSPSASPTAPTPPPGGYATLEEAADAFDCDELHDVGTGGNPGLAAFGVCRIGRHNIDIYLTSDRSLWEHLGDQFPSVLVRNLVIVCPTGAKAARIVHERIGGTLKIP